MQNQDRIGLLIAIGLIVIVYVLPAIGLILWLAAISGLSVSAWWGLLCIGAVLLLFEQPWQDNG